MPRYTPAAMTTKSAGHDRVPDSLIGGGQGLADGEADASGVAEADAEADAEARAEPDFRVEAAFWSAVTAAWIAACSRFWACP